MTIEPDVLRVAKRFGVDAALIQAVVQAEGGGQAIVRAVQCSLHDVVTREEALEVTCRSAAHAMSDYIQTTGQRQEFVEFWAKRWAPPKAENDPNGLNANWPENVRKLWMA